MTEHGNKSIPFTKLKSMKRNFILMTAMFMLCSMLSAAEPTVIRPFNGTDFDGWQFKAGNRVNVWKIGRAVGDAVSLDAAPQQGQRGQAGQGQAGQTQRNPNVRQQAAMINVVGSDYRTAEPRRGVDIFTEQKFGDCTIKLEFLVTRGSNSGVYLMGEYEVQIFDSFAKAPDAALGQGDMGAIYSAAPPARNAAGVPGTWQSYEIEFVAPKFDAEGNKTSNALFKRVVLNGVLIQENVEVQGPTGGGLTMKESATGPLMFQGDHGPVAFRNIEIIVP